MRPFSLSRVLIAAFLLFARASGPAAADGGAAASPPAASTVQKGMKVEYRVTALDNGAVVEGKYARVDFRITDASTGKPIGSLNPGAWIDIASGKGGASGDNASCRERIGVYLKGIVGMRPVLDLNSYYILILNREPSISVIDPLVGVTGKTNLFASIRLKSPGADWTRSRDQKRLFVSMPKVGQVAIVDAETFKVVANVDAGSEPLRLALQPDEAFLWVGNDAAGAGGVTVIDPREGRVAARIPTGGGHHEIAFSRDSRFAYVTNREDGTVSVIDARERRKLKDLPTGPLPISLGFSGVSDALYVADGKSGIISVVDATRQEIIARITADPGLGPIAVTDDGRFVLVVNSAENAVYAVDAAENRLVRKLPVDAKPYQIVLSRTFAFVRSLGSERVATINLIELREGRDVPVSAFPAGASPPGGDKELGVAPTIATAVGEAAVFVVNPADKSIYYYMEGMNFPTRNYQTYGFAPTSVTVIDRSLRERDPGVYSNTFRVPAAGSYDVAFILNAPAVLACFPMTAEVNPAIRRDRPAFDAEFLPGERRVGVGTTVPLRFRLTDPATGTPKSGVTDLALLYYAMPGVGKTRAAAHEVAPGIYEAPVAVRVAGAYYVHLVAPALKGTVPELPVVTLIGVENKGKGPPGTPGAKE